MYFVGAIVSGTVGGRRAHGPLPSKDWTQKVNTTENRKAIRAALAATVVRDLVQTRGHKVPKEFPFIMDTSLEQVEKAKELKALLVQLGFADELKRASEKRIRAGKGKMRGRKYKRPTSILFVTSKDDTPLEDATGNLPGMEVVPVEQLNAELLAPGTHPGRLTLFTKAAIERLDKEQLFTKNYKVAKTAETNEEKPTPAKPVVKKTPPKKSKVTA